MTVKLKHKNPEYPDLTPEQSYLVIGIEADDLRVLNDQGRPYLYPRSLFHIVDAHEPDIWVNEYGEDGERYAYPQPLNGCGFFEDFFDEDQKAVATFWRVVNEHLVAAAV